MSEVGVCAIKPEYIVERHKRELALECVSAEDKRKLESDNDTPEQGPAKKHKLSKSQQKKLRGQNKARGPTVRDLTKTELCNYLVAVTADGEPPKCVRKNCSFSHDVQEYLKNKPKDIGPTCFNYETYGICERGLACRFGSSHITEDGKNKVDLKKQEETKSNGLRTTNFMQYELQHALRKKAYNFDLSAAIISYNDKKKSGQNTKGEEKQTPVSSNSAAEDANIEENQKQNSSGPIAENTNTEEIQKQDSSDSVVVNTEPEENQEVDSTTKEAKNDGNQKEPPSDLIPMDTKNEKNQDQDSCAIAKDTKTEEIQIQPSNDSVAANTKTEDNQKQKSSGSITDEDLIKLLQKEKKKIDWRDKLMLSPLTTVGNLPFRRICKEFGADITCGEMAMCSSLLFGSMQEWALVRRHHTEDIFGVQLCANNPHLLTKCGQVLEQEAEIDFVDLNLGCPIDLIYREGGGCGLLRRQRVLESCVRNLSQVLSVPMTVKTRTGVYSNERLAHTLGFGTTEFGKFGVVGKRIVRSTSYPEEPSMNIRGCLNPEALLQKAPKFRDWGASLVTIHGRSREQRYTKMADWQYIGEVARAAAPLPVYGNGDILSYADYEAARETCPELAGVMIGRGALIKPWIFTEIKERKLWDISSGERFDIVKKYVNYGLEHWGSDNKGVENTRRFLLEWLSFLYRYVPVGLLERPPQKINERPPSYKGRDDLETLMASPSATDWIKISEMLLGPVPENFQFLPKHKANSYK